MIDEEYLNNRLQDQINYYDKVANKNHSLFKVWTIALYILSALIPIATILSELNSIAIRIFIVLLGSGIAFITNIIGLYKFQEIWIKYRTTAERLKSERVLYETKITPYDNHNTAYNLFVSNCEALMSSERNDWQKSQSTQYSDNGVSSSTGS